MHSLAFKTCYETSTVTILSLMYPMNWWGKQVTTTTTTKPQCRQKRQLLNVRFRTGMEPFKKTVFSFLQVFLRYFLYDKISVLTRIIISLKWMTNGNISFLVLCSLSPFLTEYRYIVTPKKVGLSLLQLNICHLKLERKRNIQEKVYEINVHTYNFLSPLLSFPQVQALHCLLVGSHLIHFQKSLSLNCPYSLQESFIKMLLAGRRPLTIYSFAKYSLSAHSMPGIAVNPRYIKVSDHPPSQRAEKHTIVVLKLYSLQS